MDVDVILITGLCLLAGLSSDVMNQQVTVMNWRSDNQPVTTNTFMDYLKWSNNELGDLVYKSRHLSMELAWIERTSNRSNIYVCM